MLNYHNHPTRYMTVISSRSEGVLTSDLCIWREIFSAVALWFALSAERREGRVHGHHVRGGLRPREAFGDRTPGARPACAHPSATMEERKQDRSEEWGKTLWHTLAYVSRNPLKLRCQRFQGVSEGDPKCILLYLLILVIIWWIIVSSWIKDAWLRWTFIFLDHDI